MPFDLKNIRALFQRLVNKLFWDLIGHSMEIYMDDMIIKSNHTKDYISNLSETFDILKEYGLKLNPNNCLFKVGSSKFLGFYGQPKRN